MDQMSSFLSNCSVHRHRGYMSMHRLIKITLDVVFLRFGRNSFTIILRQQPRGVSRRRRRTALSVLYFYPNARNSSGLPLDYLLQLNFDVKQFLIKLYLVVFNENHNIICKLTTLFNVKRFATFFEFCNPLQEYQQFLRIWQPYHYVSEKNCQTLVSYVPNYFLA